MSAHSMRSVWILLIPAFCVEEALRSDAVWLTKTLLICAGFVSPGILLPAVVRRIAYPLAGVVAALSGGLLSIAASSLAAPNSSNTAEIGPCTLALLVAGAAALAGQVLGQRDQDRAESALLSQISGLEAAVKERPSGTSAQRRRVPLRGARQERHRWIAPHRDLSSPSAEQNARHRDGPE